MGLDGGSRDYLDLGTWNVMCGRCGRKRKAYELVKDAYTNLLMCPEHADSRQPQDFARGIKESMAAPVIQPPSVLFTEVSPTFPVGCYPSSLDITGISPGSVLTTESGVPLETQSDEELLLEGSASGYTTGLLTVQLPSWVIAQAWQWSWLSGGAGVNINSPQSASTTLTWSPVAGAVSGVLQCMVTSTLEAIGYAQVPISLAT